FRPFSDDQQKQRPSQASTGMQPWRLKYLPKALHIAALRSDLIKADSPLPTPFEPSAVRFGDGSFREIARAT
ncbi:hypothetical protein, partial [Devosia sediminis]|uniref:hypothetical protein n=1 Tax=Devosia sediminis TaxID=2798801 RepID=UPI001AEE2F18